MARGAEAKVRRRNNRKNKDGNTDVIDMFGDGNHAGGTHTFGAAAAPDDEDEKKSDPSLPVPPGMKGSAAAASKKQAATVDDDDSENSDEIDNLPKRGSRRGARSGGGGGGGGIKTTPLILLIIMTGTTILPALIFASDYISTFMAKNKVMGKVGYSLGLGAVPRKRVLSFYEKHAPEKIPNVPTILSKHYGDYPRLIKQLEKKYGDYGYFLGWEEDEAPLRLAVDQVKDLYDVWLQRYWNRHAPQVLKTAARNFRYNVTFLVKKFQKVWKKKIWPLLEPFLGVPEGAEKQKRKDAMDARKKRVKREGTRRRNTDYRDDEDE